MAYASPLDNTVALNPQGLDALRQMGNRGQTREAVKGAASQFEAYFMQMMLRSMRQTLPQDGPFDSQETKTFTDMFDQQVAQKISQGKGLGLADMMLSQLGKIVPADKPAQTVATDAAGQAPTTEANRASPAMGVSDSIKAPPAATTPGSFVDRLWPQAVDAAKTLGVSPHILIGHAALETGWGEHELKGADGTSSNNLFNIKAGSNWTGKTVEKAVTEYVNGKPVSSVEKFRAYDSPEESFADYAQLLSTNSRYSGTLNQDAEGFVRGLQQGGFATDPAYGDKLKRVIGSAALKSGLVG
jgi:flagellar protein FlgJ